MAPSRWPSTFAKRFGDRPDPRHMTPAEGAGHVVELADVAGAAMDVTQGGPMTTSQSIESDLARDPKWGSSPPHHCLRLRLHRRARPALRLYDKGRGASRSAATAWTGALRSTRSNPVGLPDELPLFGTTSCENGRQAEGRAAPPRRGLALQPVPARRAGRADLHCQDRADRCPTSTRSLRRHPGDGRGPPRRGFQPLLHEKLGLPIPDEASRRCSTMSSRTAAGT